MAYVMESELGAQTIINQNLVDYFGGCSYFGFQVHHEVIAAACDAAQRFGISSATSVEGYGNNPVLIDLEDKVKLFFGTHGVLHYASGCLGNYILLEGLRNDYDAIFVDLEAHHSIKNATTMMDKPVFDFKHNDPEDLEKVLDEQLRRRWRPLIICDGIFPVSGELAPVPEYIEILNKYENSTICLDDAHAIGVIGEKGYGTFEYFGLEGDRRHTSGVLSKALGGHGGLIVGDVPFTAKLKMNSSLANACSKTPIPAAAATAKALEILHHHPEMRTELWENTWLAKGLLKEIGFDVNDTPVPIICLSTIDNGREQIDCHRIQKALFEKNVAVTYVPSGAYTSVPVNGAIRISIFCTHTEDQIRNLVNELKALI